eukprot:gb/GEZN01004655.1/.p1 GENE.gb/GEZN01004655.1/~~gb/GEZN01004655.1/.p1  ORF type:complete len:470 (+),score=85.00 gb/GEZN01004655.1/:121-1530(+)
MSKYHFIRKASLMQPPFPEGLEVMVFAAGCFWGTEKGFWRIPGVYTTAVGYIAGNVENPTYRQVCAGTTGHTECTQVVWDPKEVSASDMLHHFWDCHDPTQGNGQGNDRGTQYRSGIYCTTLEQLALARSSLKAFEAALSKQGYGPITSELKGPDAKGLPPKFWYAEDYHQQYLAKPGNRQYCSAEPTGVTVPGFETWPDISEALRAKYKPKLPSAFWSTFDGSLRAPHAPAVWDFGNADAVKNAEEKAQALQKVSDAQKAEVQKSSEVVIQYCGGCGFKVQADELKQYLECALPGKKVGLLQDFGTTGNFEVSVKRGDGSWALVHSKKEKNQGFVDSQAKKNQIVAAIAGIATASSGASKSVASPLVSGDAKAIISSQVDANKVMIFSKSWCPYSKRAKEQFKDLGVPFEALELDQLETGDAIQQQLSKLTGIFTVPVVYVQGQLIGDSDATVKARQSGKFDELKANM